MYQFYVRRKQIFEAKAVDSMSMPAAHFHNAVTPPRIGQPPYLLRRPSYNFRLAKLVNKFHNKTSSRTRLPPPSAHFAEGGCVRQLRCLKTPERQHHPFHTLPLPASPPQTLPTSEAFASDRSHVFPLLSSGK